jgi:hypothetical protein
MDAWSRSLNLAAAEQRESREVLPALDIGGVLMDVHGEGGATLYAADFGVAYPAVEYAVDASAG